VSKRTPGSLFPERGVVYTTAPVKSKGKKGTGGRPPGLSERRYRRPVVDQPFLFALPDFDEEPEDREEEELERPDEDERPEDPLERGALTDRPEEEPEERGAL